MVPRVGDTAFLQHISNPLQHTLSAFWQNRPKRRKVGDTLTATVKPADATVVYQWYADGKAIEGATDDELHVTIDMIGSKISVAVADAKGNKDVSDETAPVAVYEALEILSADQTGAKTVALTFSDDVTASDKLTVKKGSTEVKIDSPTYGDASATITLADKIIAGGKYTVTLTPANGDPATSVDFEGETATLDRIEFLNKKLVLKDNTYQEGYAYVKGYDQFGGEVPLSGLTVTAGVGEMTAYDSDTGKITLRSETENAYMLIKEVPVFVQLQVGNEMKTAQETLEVSTRSFVDKIEFGEIKKDGDKRADGRLTITELSGGKYYVELLSVKDQYGNDLSADDLNDQAEDHVLFVIPSDTGAFYTTGKFGTIKNKTVLWLAAPRGGAKPGEMPLTITGAGGKSFTMDIEVEDDPYINTMTITYPELYSGASKSKKMDFVAVDQYLNAIDLWQFKPTVSPDGSTLTFGDSNHMTSESTKIVLSQNAKFNTVTENSATKQFEVTVDASDAAAKSMVVFTTTTAGVKVFTHTVTVGEIGVAIKVKSPTTASVQLDQATNVDLDEDGFNDVGAGSATSLNFNNTVQFEDVNGNTMVRGKDALYPYFTSADLTILKTDPDIKPKQYKTFAWTLTNKKIPDNTTTDPHTISDLDGTIVCNTTGVITAADFNTKADYYVTVFGTTDDPGNAASSWYKLDQQSFHVTEVVGTDKDTSYSITAPKTLYIAKDSRDAKTVSVKATTDNGETYTIAANRISLTLDSRWKVTNNSVSGKVNTDLVSGTGSVEATVWVTTPAGAKVEAGTVKIPYSDAKPVATTAKLEWAVAAEDAGSFVQSRVGAAISGSVSDIELGNNALDDPEATITNGKLEIIDGTVLGDKITAKIEDQYGVQMLDTKYFLNGETVTDLSEIAAGDRGAIEYRSGNVTNKFYFTADAYALDFTTDADETDIPVTDMKSLIEALAANPTTVTLADNIETNAAITVPADTTLIIPEGYTLNTGAFGATIEGDAEVKVDGLWVATGGTVKNEGVVFGNGHVTLTAAEMTGAGGEWTVARDTLEMIGCTLADGATQSFGGHVEIKDTAGSTTTIAGTFTILNGAVIDLTGADLEENSAQNIVLGDEATAVVKDQNGNTVVPDEQGDLPLADGDADDAEVARIQALLDALYTAYGDLDEEDDETITALGTAYTAAATAIEALDATEDAGIIAELKNSEGTAFTNYAAIGTYLDTVEADYIITETAVTLIGALENVSATGATFVIPATYKAQVTDTDDTAAITAPTTNVSSTRWNYADGTFTVDSEDNEETATAVWTLSSGSREATVTLTLTGTEGAATFTSDVEMGTITDKA